MVRSVNVQRKLCTLETTLTLAQKAIKEASGLEYIRKKVLMQLYRVLVGSMKCSVKCPCPT